MEKECVYCGTTENLTDEHSPPKLIFPKPRPNNLVIVPACLKCNKDGEKDAEYFRLCLCLNEETGKSNTARAGKETALRGLHRAEAEGFRTYFQSGLAFSDGRFSFHVEMKRVHLVVERTVQCLYLHETGKRLPDTHEAFALSNDYLSQFDAEGNRKFQENFVEPLSKREPKIIGTDELAPTSKPFVSAWGLVFYGSIPFVVLTGPKKRK